MKQKPFEIFLHKTFIGCNPIQSQDGQMKTSPFCKVKERYERAKIKPDVGGSVFFFCCVSKSICSDFKLEVSS